MHQFICKSIKGKIVPLSKSKESLLNRIINSYEEQGIKFKVSIELINKNLKESQLSLYRGFVLKASEHFGNTYQEMEDILKQFYSSDKEVESWSTKELSIFIDKASSHLAQFGFNY